MVLVGDTEYFRLDGGDSVTKISKTMLHFDNVKASFGNSEDMRIKHDGTDGSIDNYTGNLEIRNNTDDGDINFRSDNGSGGLTTYFAIDGGGEYNRFYKNAYFTDNVKALFGSSSDLQIYHDSNNSWISDAGTGSLIINGDNVYLRSYGGESKADFITNGAVTLYYDNAAKLATKSDGVDITGELQADSLDIDGNADISGNLVLGGDLTVNGSTTTLNTATLTVDDLNITVADGAANAAAANGAGLTVDGASATLTYVSTGDKWSLNKPLDVLFAGDDGVKIESSDNHSSLFIDSHTAYGQYIRFTENNANKYWINSASGKLKFRPAGTSTVTSYVVFDASGKVGIGTSSPTEKLHIHGGGIYTTPVTYAGNQDGWALKIGASNNAGWDFSGIKLRVNSTGSPRMSLMSRGAESMSLDGGNVGIGTDYATEKLQVTGNIAVSGTVDGVDIAARDAILTSTTTTAGAALPKAGGTMTGALNMDGNRLNNVYTLQLRNGELGDFNGTRQMMVDANDGDSNVPAHGDYAGTYPFGIYFTGDNDSATTTLGNGLVKVWHTGHFNKAHIDYFVGLYNTGVTTTEYDYLDGVTSNIQTQLNSKLSTSGTAVQATNLNATDDRDVAPEDLNYTDDLRIFFTTKEGLEAGSGTGSNYQDAIYLNSYTDASGGDANLLAFDKSEKKIYHYQADQAATNWGTAKTLAYTDSNITGTAAGLTGTPNISVGNITVSGTVDGVDIAARNGVLTSTTTTANAALPKAGGTMTGNIAHASNFTIDAGGDISLDADGGDILFKDAGTTFGKFTNNSNNLHIVAVGADNDIKFFGNDGGSSVTALTLDMSNAGAATFNGTVTATGGNSTNWNTAYTVANAALPKAGGTMTGALVINKAAESLANQPSIISTFDSTGTDGLALISVEHLTNSGASALGAGLRFQVGDGATGTADKQSYIFQRGGSSLPLVYIADKSHEFYVDHHDNNIDGTSYSDYGTLALTLNEAGNVVATGTVTATGGNSTNWNTAYGWGNHASASYATQSYVGTQISNLVDSSPAALNTLNELAAALGDNENFATDVNASIAAKLPLAGGTMTGPITTNSTFDGVDIAARDAVLTSTTTTANAALPKAGGTMTGSVAMGNFNITGVNQLEINDPGEGIVFKAGSSGDMQLRILDDASDNILQYSGTNAVFDVQGTITATAKSFDIEHPSKKGMRLKHGVVEGPEHSVYVRGKSKEKVILLPDYWVDLIHKDTITVQLTAIGSEQDLYVEDIKDNKVFVNGDNYFYYVQAERKDVDRFEVEYESNL